MYTFIILTRYTDRFTFFWQCSFLNFSHNLLSCFKCTTCKFSCSLHQNVTHTICSLTKGSHFPPRGRPPSRNVLLGRRHLFLDDIPSNPGEGIRPFRPTHTHQAAAGMLTAGHRTYNPHPTDSDCHRNASEMLQASR